jgi:hypothetical protein
MRDQQGRFARAKEDAIGFLTLIYYLYQLLPLIIFVICVYYYYDIPSSIRQTLLKVICGSNYESCTCKDGVNGGSYWNSK